MTPGEMRRRAAELRARAARLDTAAAKLRTIADGIRNLLADLSSRSRAVWQGPAATEFEQAADAADRDVKAQAALLTTTASDMEQAARRLRTEAAQLEAEAAAAEAAAATAGVGGSVPAHVE